MSTPSSPSAASSTGDLQELIDDCVHCGFCLPTCPTYGLWAEEMDSPRGRIVLMGELADGRISEPLVEHIDQCLGCMACVTACPSGVQYDLLVNRARAVIEERHTRPLLERLKRRAIFATFPYHRRLRALIPLLPLARLAPFAAADLAPKRPPRIPPLPPVVGSGTRIGFLQGCVQRAYFPHVNAATVGVLAAEGYEVHTRPDVGCCGSLELHAGEAERAERRALAVAAAFEDVDTIVVNAAGCGSGLKEHPRLRDKVKDVTEVVQPRPRRHLGLKVAYHDACHLAHAQGIRAQPRALLEGVVDLVEPAEWEICCGSAGTYNLTNPDAAAELGRRKAANLAATGADAIVAANPGCALQIAAHLDLPVYHPMEVLWSSSTGRPLRS